MGIMIDGTILSARGVGLSNLINGYISKKQQTLQSLYEQQAAIEDMYNTVASGLYTAQSSIYQLNTYYNNQILSKNSAITNLQNQIKKADNKIAGLDSMYSSVKTTVSSLDDFLNSVRESSNASSIIDFSNTNTNALDVTITNSEGLNTQRIEYNVKQVATATKATSYTLNAYNLSKDTLIKDIFAGTYDSSILTGTRNDLTENITMRQLGVTEGYWEIGTTSLYIGEGDTLKSVADRLKADGYNAGIRNGQFFIDGRNVKAMNIHNQQSNLGEVLGLTVSTGNFSINGQSITIDDSTSIQSLLNTINDINADYGVGAYFENNQLTLVANLTGNVLIEIDKGTSSFTNVAGFTIGGRMITENLTLGSDGSSQVLSGSNDVSSVVGNISAGEFVLRKTHNGVTEKATITVTPGANLDATLNNVIAQINACSLNLTAAIEGDKFVIKNKELGAGYDISIESGETDFSEKLGFTNPVLSTGMPAYDENTNYFTRLVGITDIASITTANTVTAGSFKINGTTINLSAGTLQSAINTINSYKNTTGVIAEYDGSHMILRNEYTGDRNLTVDGGTSNFGEICGFTTQSVNTATSTYGQVGSKSTLTGAETVSSSLAIGDSVLMINGTEVDITAGTLQNVVTQLNNDYSSILNLTFSINAQNKLVITEKRNGELPISVSSVSGNFAELTGICGYQTTIGQEEKYGSSKTVYTATRDVSNNTQILDSTVILNGHEIALSGSVSDAILTINSRSSLTGVEAYIDTNNKFTLRNTTAGSTAINFAVLSGDFGRVVGTGSYSTTSGTTSHTDRVLATVTGANTGLNEFTQVLVGSKIQFGAKIIDLGASVGAALLAINSNKDVTGVEAYLNAQGQFVLKAVNDEMASISFSVIGSGNFGYVTGLGSYTFGGAASNGEVINYSYSKLTGSNNVSTTTEITASSITLGYVNDQGTNVTKTFQLNDGTLEDAMKVINDSNWYVKAEIVDNKLQFVSRSAGPFTISVAVNSVNGVTGDFGRVVGMGNNIAAAGSKSNLSKDAAKYVGATTGLNATDELIGTNTISLWMTRTLTGTGVNTEGGSGSLASVSQTVTFVDKDGDGKITLQDAVDSINDVKSTTKIEAAIIDGRFVLTQIDANTAGEGDTINFTLSGDGDFARVAGYGSYTTIGQSNTGSVTGQSFTTLVGSRNIENTNEVLAGSFTLTLTKGSVQNAPEVNQTATINIADGTMQNAISSINTQLAAAGIAVTASITDGKLQFKSDVAGNYNISVNMDNSDFGRVVGIGSHTTSDGSASSVEKTAAKVTGGVTGLTRDNYMLGTMQITLQGLVTRTTTGVNTEGGTNNALSSIRTITLSGTIGDAIDAINEQSSSTQIRAYLDAQGRFVLEQTNQNTASEFDTISFSLSGTGDFGAITGLGSYISYGQTNQGSTIGQKYTSIAGVAENLKGTEQITAGTITIKFTDDVSVWNTPVERTLTVDISGTVEEAVSQINAKAAAEGYSLFSYIDEETGRFTIQSSSYGQDRISVSVADSDFARITGIANYRMDYATVTGANSSYDMHPVLVGGNEVYGEQVIINGSIWIDGNQINTVNKTLDQIVQEINNLGVAGVTADLETGYFRIKMLENSVSDPVNIYASDDFARVTGLGSYSVGTATFVDGSVERTDGTASYVTKSVVGLSNTTKFVGGSVTIEHNDGYGGTSSFTVDTTGKTVAQVVSEINTRGQSGASVDTEDGFSLNYVYASFANGQISIRTNENVHAVSATGDFARVTGFSAYSVEAAQNVSATTTTEEGTLKHTSRNKTTLSGTTVFSDGSISVKFYNGVNGEKEISVRADGLTVQQVVDELQRQTESYYADYSKDGYVLTRPEITFDETTGKISVTTYGDSHTVEATGSVATLTGFYDAGDYSYTVEATKPIVTYYKDGVLTGSTDVSSSDGQALYGQAGTIDFYNGMHKIGTITVSETDTLSQVLAKISAVSLDNEAPTDSSNVDYDASNSITASIVDGKIQLQYGAGMDRLSVSGTSSFVYFYGLGSTETTIAKRSTEYNVSNSDVYIYSNGSITGSVDVKTMITSGSLTVGSTGVNAFSGQRNGVLSFVSTVDSNTTVVGNVQILATDTLDDVMNKINNMTSVDAVTPEGIYINKINGFSASFTADGNIEITYGGQQGAVRIVDTSGFAQYYGLTDSSAAVSANTHYEQMERPYPDRVGQSVVTGSTIGYNINTVVGSLQSGTFSVALNGKTINVSYTNTESLSVILGRLMETANQTDGTGLYDYNGDLDLNINPIDGDKLTYSINSDGQIVISAGVENRTEDKLVITDLSGNFARITGIATTPESYAGESGLVTPPATPGIAVDGTQYYVTVSSQTGAHGSFSYVGASVNSLTGNTVLTGLQNGGFYFETTDGNKWIEVHTGDTVNDVLARINALKPGSINAVFDETNNRIKITATNNALQKVSITGDTSGFVMRTGLSSSDYTSVANYTNVQESYGHAKIWGSVGNLHESHKLGNIQGGLNSATETVTLSDGAGNVNIAVSDDESLSSIIQKIKNTNKFDAGITDGRMWIKSLADSSEEVVVSESNFARILGFDGDTETMSNGLLTVGAYGTFSYTGASIAGLLGSSNLTIDSSLAGAGDGSIKITLSDKTANTVNIASVSFDISVTKDMTVDDIITAIRTAAVNAGVSGFDISFDNSTHQVKVSVSGNQAEQITFTGNNAKGTELVKRMGLATSDSVMTNNGTSTKETSGYTRFTGSVSGLHGTHVMGNLTSETFTISGANGNASITVTSGQSLSQIIAAVTTQSAGKYTAGIDGEGRFYIQSTAQSSSAINVSSTDFTRRVGLVASNASQGPSSQTAVGSHGTFEFYGGGGTGGTGVDGMTGTTVFAGLRNGSFNFTLGGTSITTPAGESVYHNTRTFTVNVSSTDSVQAILNNMKDAIVATGEYSNAELNFTVDVDEVTGKGRIHISMNGKDSSQITFSNDTTGVDEKGFVTLAGLSNAGATTSASYTSVNRSYGKAGMTGSMTDLSASHVFGNMQAGTMVLQAGGISKTVNIAANDSIQAIADKISAGGQFTAGIDAQGRFYVRTVSDTASDVSVSGTSDFYKLVGMTGANWNYTPTNTAGSFGYSKITGSVSGLTADQKFNNMINGTFTISAAGLRTLTVSISAGTTKISDVINYINSTATSDYHAELNSNGQLVINTKVANGATVIVRDGTSNYAQIMGLTAGTISGSANSVTGVSDKYSTLQGATTGLDNGAKFAAGDFTIYVKAPDNTVKSKTFTLTGTETLSTIMSTLSNASNGLGITAKLDSVTGQLVLESKNVGAYEITCVDGTTNFSEATGLSKNHSQIKEAEKGTLAVLTSSKTAQNANLLGYTAGSFLVSLTDKSGNVTSTQKISIAEGETIEQICAKITGSAIGVKAEIDPVTGRMVLTRKSSTTDGGIKITKGTSDFTNKIGLTLGGEQSAAAVVTNGIDPSNAVLKGAQLTSANTSTKLGMLGIKDGTMIINNKTIEVLQSDTIQQLLDKINSAFTAGDTNGVTATFENDRIVLTSKIKSDNARINVETGSSNITNILGFTNGATLNTSNQEVGLNSIINLNGVDHESMSNIVAMDVDGNIVDADSVEEAFRLTIKELGNGIVDIGKGSVTDTYMKLLTFANNFNSAMILAQNQVLAEDPGFQSLIATLKSAITDDVGPITKVEKALADIGITLYSTLTSTGNTRLSMLINREKFETAMVTDTSVVTNLLIGNDEEPLEYTQAGSFVRLKAAMDDTLKPVSGYFKANSRIIGAQRDALQKELTVTRGELAQLETELANATRDNEAVKQKEELEQFLQDITEQYKTITSLIERLNKQYTQSLNVLAINKNNLSFN